MLLEENLLNMLLFVPIGGLLELCLKRIKWKPKSCTRGDRNPDHIAKNYLHREFHAEKPNEKYVLSGPSR